MTPLLFVLLCSCNGGRVCTVHFSTVGGNSAPKNLVAIEEEEYLRQCCFTTHNG